MNLVRVYHVNLNRGHNMHELVRIDLVRVCTHDHVGLKRVHNKSG